jgi:hypothetical protein
LRVRPSFGAHFQPHRAAFTASMGLRKIEPLVATANDGTGERVLMER